MELCPTHQLEYRLVPSGISKRTGKPFNSFFSCPEYGCKEKPTSKPPVAPAASEGPTTKPWPGSQKWTRTPGTPKPEPVSDQVWERKDRTSIAQTAIKAAASIYEGQGVPSDEAIAYAEKLYRWIMDKRQDNDQDAPPVFDEEGDQPY